MKRKNSKAPDASHNESVEAFRALADTLATETPAFAETFAEPWPDWMCKMGVRITRIVAPQIIEAAKRGDDEFMFGQVVAAEMLMVELLEKMDVIREIRKLNEPCWGFILEQLAIIGGPEANRLKAVKKAAADLPVKHSASFFKSVGDGLKKNVLDDSLERTSSSTTVLICFFLMVHRVPIEKRAFKNVTQLAERFLKLRELLGEMPAEKEAIRASIMAQFRKICSEAGLKLSPRGRPSIK